MSRREELVNIIPDDSLELVTDIIDQIIFLEDKLTELKELPFIEVNSKNPMKQRNTPAAKMYKEFLEISQTIFVQRNTILRNNQLLFNIFKRY